MFQTPDSLLADQHDEGQEDEAGCGADDAGNDPGVVFQGVGHLGEGLVWVTLAPDENPSRDGRGTLVECATLQGALDEGADAQVVDGFHRQIGEKGLDKEIDRVRERFSKGRTEARFLNIQSWFFQHLGSS